MKTKWNLNTFAWVNENKLPSFGRLLSSWLNVHRTFCEEAQPDFSWEWGHNERAQIGLLGNAATLIGGVSIEEGCIEKHSGSGQKSQGRSDLWLRFPTLDCDYLVEAKIEQYLDVTEPNTAVQKILNKMSAARQNAESLKHRKEKIVAMTFLSLRFADENLDSLSQKTDDVISHIWNKIRNEQKLDAIGAIWMNAHDLQQSREERRAMDSKWTNVHFGMVLLASRIEISE